MGGAAFAGVTTVDLPVDDDQVFTMRQVTLLVANNKTGRQELGRDSTRQIHILTTRGDLTTGEVIYRMGSRWRQENYFRYARMHFDLDSTTRTPPPTTTLRVWSQPGQEESPPTGTGSTGQVRPGTGRDWRSDAGSGVPTAGSVGADH